MNSQLCCISKSFLISLLKNKMADINQGHIDHNDFIRHEGIKRLSKLLKPLMSDKIIVASHLEKDFNLDHKTLDKLKQGDLTIAKYTLDKMRSAIAYYLGEHRAKVNRINDDEIKRKKLEKISEYEDSYKSIFGYQVDACLILYNKGEDLRLPYNPKRIKIPGN